MRQQEEVAFALVIGTFLFLFLCICLLLFFVLFKNSRKRYMEEKKSLQLSYKNELANAIIELQENRFLNISRELHDNIGQLLTVARIHLNALVKNPEKRTNEKISETNEVVELAINELKALSKALNPDKIKQLGLVYALKMESERINKLEMLKTSLVIKGEAYSLSGDTEIIVFRIAQEFIANTVKYASASELKIALEFYNDKFVLEMEDDGKGFNMDEQMNSGSGILNIKNRAALIASDFKFESITDKGTVLHLTIYRSKIEVEVHTT